LFFEKSASGLSDLADALDQAVKEGTASASIVKAAQIAFELSERATRWMEQNATSSIDRVYNAGLFVGAMILLHWLGAGGDGTALGLSGVIIHSGGKRKGSPKRREKATSKGKPQRGS
jgi:hypothetical protein